ncbi:hypothetical protein [Citrobacter tructae]|uniref:hypothetical protein n=1 Tax=Citrobacter tructae TaxID=2562449 RepID=UPI003F55E270
MDSDATFNRAGEYYNYDPLVLDVDGDGIEIIDINSNRNIYFDHNNDGIKTVTSWVDSDDGFLVMDRNNDGVINNGGELFGDSTLMSDGSEAPNGFAALAELDSDHNGVINSLDEKFTLLSVWRDLNADGISQSNELFSLTEIGIREINLTSSKVNNELTGDNIETDKSTYTDDEGNAHTISDLNFSFSNFNREFIEPIALTEEQSQQLNLGGSGTLRDLREAAALSPELNACQEQFKSATTKAEQLLIIPTLVAEWAKTSDYYSESIDVLPAFEKTKSEGSKVIGQKKSC